MSLLMALPQPTIEDQFQEHEPRLRGFCRRLIGDSEAARDITQDVFLQACHSQRQDAAWLYVCARSRCIDYLRRRSLWKRFLDSLTPLTTGGSTFEDELADRDLGWSILRRLPEKQRSLLLLRAYAGLDYEELARLFETSPQAIGVMLHRARKRASQLLEGDR